MLCVVEGCHLLRRWRTGGVTDADEPGPARRRHPLDEIVAFTRGGAENRSHEDICRGSGSIPLSKQGRATAAAAIPAAAVPAAAIPDAAVPAAAAIPRRRNESVRGDDGGYVRDKVW